MTIPMFGRRAALGLGLGLGLAAALGLGLTAPAQAEETEMTFVLDWTPHGMHAPFFLAAEKGWFKEAGLDVTFQDGRGSASTVNLVGAGQGDLGHAGLNTMAIARTKGLPVTAVGSILRKNEVGILFDRGKGYQKPEDFKGKSLIFTAGSTEAPFIESFLKAGGMTDSDVELMAVDPAAKVSTYLSGQGDGVITPVPFIMAISEGKRNSDGVLFADFGMPLLSWGIIANDDYLEEHPEAVKAFMAVLARAWAYVLESDAHLTEAVEAIQSQRPEAKVSMPAGKAIFNAYRPYFYSPSTEGKPIGTMTAADWDDTIATMKKLGLVPEDAKAEEFYSLDYQPPQS
ncbi:ABC transporter substrate-binding protein [Marinibaculum pumilum]|uniref:Thiamine pyrimidine synthase n=1 Tax=Marinibaculum pumilum TaxID=1766165 RepID=A0ABV7L206_9PROT